MISTFNLFNSIAWLISGIISAIISLFFLLKNPKKRLNQFYSIGFIFWSFSLIFNGINLAVAHSSLLIANIFRDFCVVTGIISALTLFLATLGIYFGAEKVNWITTAITTCVAIILSIFGTLNDWVVEDPIEGFKTTDNWLGKTSSQIIPALFVITCLVLLTINYFNLEKSVAKKRIGFFIIGFTAILFGLVMFVLDAIIPASPYLFITIAITSWVFGPVLMLIGFYVKEENPYKEIKGIEKLDSKSLDPKQQQKLERPS